MKRSNVLRQYLIGVISVVLATILRQWLSPWLGGNHPFSTYTLAALFTAWYADAGPAFVVLILGGMTGEYLFGAPQHSLMVALTYSIVSITGVVLIQRQRIAQRLAEDSARESRQRQEELEQEIQQRKQVEDALRTAHRDLQRAKEAAETASRAKDEFLAVCSHELRSPLTPILGWADLLQGGKLNRQQAGRAVDVIRQNAKLQRQLVDDLLDISRIVSGKLLLRPQTIRLNYLIESAIETVRHAAFVKEIDIRVSQEVSASTVSGDAARLQQVLWNLLSNAIKFTPQKGCIHVRQSRVDSNVEISVADNGRGIPAEFIPFVFDRFSQADSGCSRQHGGLGLGLAIARHLVELHGGTIRVESEGLGLGAKFIISLPLKPATSACSSDLYSEFPPANAAALDGMRILLIDDDQSCLECVATTLEQWGASVSTSGSVKEAIEMLELEQPDLLIGDIGMPGEDGYALIRKVRERHDHIPAIALTAYASHDDQERALLAGYQLHMTKPIDAPKLVAAAAAVGRKH